MQRDKLQKEFERQTDNLLEKGYPSLATLSSDEFISLLKPLEKKLEWQSLPEVDMEKGVLPFVIVVKSNFAPTEKAMQLVERDGKHGITKLFPHSPEDFDTINGTILPSASVYLMTDIDRGKNNRNLPPSEAMKLIQKDKRLPLTIDEGIAIVTQYPDFLMKNNCFSLLASRHEGDQRVPAIWINAKQHPNLGWCWEGNPHTWLGSASCGKRIK